MPAARPAIFTDTVEFVGVVPEVGLTLSQGALLLILLLKVIGLPVLLILSVWLAGLAPPCVAVKLRLVGLTTRRGFTIKVTGTLTGGVFPEVAEIVMVAL